MGDSSGSESSYDQEDITYNIFFKTLKQQYAELYKKAEINCWVICVPRADSCEGMKITKSIIGNYSLLGRLSSFDFILPVYL